MPVIDLYSPTDTVSIQPNAGRNLVVVSMNGKVTINWDNVRAEAADPKGLNRGWAWALLCAAGEKCDFTAKTTRP